LLWYALFCRELPDWGYIDTGNDLLNVPRRHVHGVYGATLQRKHDAASHSRKLEFANVNSYVPISRFNLLGLNLNLDLDAGGGLLIGLSGE
jgi:hypothetical protein